MSNYNNLVCMCNFVKNLNSYMAFKNFSSIKDLSIYFNINVKTLESWMYFKRCPYITMLDAIADLLNVYTDDLIGKEINFSEIDINRCISNNSFLTFPVNLRKFLNRNDIKSAQDFKCITNNLVSTHTYYSYFKTTNFKLPSLKMLENISYFLNIEPYKLIERNDTVE